MYDVETLKLAKLRYEIECELLRAARGAPAQPANPRQQWAALVDAKVAAGISRVEAIKATMHENHALYRQQLVPAAQFRASR